MQINIVYDASVASAPAGFKTAVQAAVQFWETELTNPITVTIAFGWGEVDGSKIGSDAIGESEGNGLDFSYGQVRAALTAAATSPEDVQSVASLPAANPTGGSQFYVTDAEALALGLPTDGSPLAGFVGLNSTVAYTFDPNNRSVAGDFDAIGALEHEISEVLGRIAGSGEPQDHVAQYDPLDLFRYIAPGFLQLKPGAGSFSTDGQTLLLPFGSSRVQDAGDWDPSVVGDSFGDATPGLAGLVSPTDLSVMDVLGYTLPKTNVGTGLGCAEALSGLASWAYDSQDGLFYLATITGLVEAYNPVTQTASALASLGATVQGLAVSPDGTHVYAALQGSAAQTIDEINLATQQVQALTYTGAGMADGPASIVITPQGVGYFTSAFSGSGDTPAETFSTAGAFSPTTLAAAPSLGAGSEAPPDRDSAPRVFLSENGLYALFVDTDDTQSDMVLVNAQTGALVAETSQMALGGDGVANAGKDDVNDAAGLVVDVSFSQVLVLNLALQVVEDLSSLQSTHGAIIGAHFNQTGTELYLWDQATQDLLVYDTANWQQVGTIPVMTPVTGANDSGGSEVGTMSLADNGRLMFLDTGTGFEIVDLGVGVHTDDFAGAGTSDILFGQASGALADWQMLGTGIVGGGALGSPGGTWAEVGTGDFNGDGRTDILFQDAGQNLAIWEMEGTAIIGGGGIGNPGGSWHVAGVGDFNGDGDADILFQDASGNLALWEMSGTTIIGGGAIGNPGGTWAEKGVGDFNGDGKSDILFEDAGGNYAIWEMNGTSIIGGGAIGNPGPGWVEKGIGDFNGDGMSDILFQNASSGDYAIWEMNGTTIIGGGDIGNPGGTWQFAGIGDYNGDGHADILFTDAAGDLSIWEMNGTSIIGGGDIGNPGSPWHVLG